jgi:hypothetical protein
MSEKISGSFFICEIANSGLNAEFYPGRRAVRSRPPRRLEIYSADIASSRKFGDLRIDAEPDLR